MDSLPNGRAGGNPCPSFPTTSAEAALRYHSLGFIPIPVKSQGKNPILSGWRSLRPSADDLANLFPPGERRNVGLLLGEPSGGLVDVDLDCAEAAKAAPLILPPTGWVSGRASNPNSHLWYITDSPPPRATEQFTDVDGTVLVELRSTGGQTVVPPSVHESGESVDWHSYTDAGPASFGIDELKEQVRTLAAVAILARHWPHKGGRQEANLALMGGVLRAGRPVAWVETFVRALAVASHDEEVEKRVATVSATAEKLANGQAVTGWPRLAELLGEQGSAVVDRVREWISTCADAVISVPSRRIQLPWPKPPDLAAYYGLAGRVVRVIEPSSEADPIALLAQFIAAFGNIVGRRAYFPVEGDRHFCNLFVVLVGRTSKGRKGTAWGRIRQLFQETDATWLVERVMSGLSSGEGLVYHVRDPIVTRHLVKERGKITGHQEVESDPGVNDKRLLALEPEFGSVLKLIDRQGNILSPMLRQCWDNGVLRTLTKNSPLRATGAHVTVVGHVTIDELLRYLSATEQANGFGNRFLWLCVQRSKQLPDGGGDLGQEWQALAAEVKLAVEFAQSVGRMEFAPSARADWHAVYEKLSTERPGLAGILTNRAEAQVIRMAMIHALLNHSAVIETSHLEAALALWEYSEASVNYIFGDGVGDALADQILCAIRANSGGLTRNNIRELVGHGVPADRIERALQLLLRHSLASPALKATGGRPAEIWCANAGTEQTATTTPKDAPNPDKQETRP